MKKTAKKQNGKRNLPYGPAVIRRAAKQLLQDPLFLFRVGRKLKNIGLIGEELCSLVLLLTLITKCLDEPVSAVIKASSSTGKSNLMRKVLSLFPPEVVHELSMLTKKAPIYNSETLQGQIIYIQEHKGGKDAQLFIRLAQSEGTIRQESTVGQGARRTTKVFERHGSPVVVTTMTARQMLIDDETRFISLSLDESEEQTRRIVLAKTIGNEQPDDQPSVEVFQEAVRIVTDKIPTISNPSWLKFVAENIPHTDVRIRRDWPKVLTLLRAIALCRRFSTGNSESTKVEISLADYCVAYKLLNTVFDSTLNTVPEEQSAVAIFIRKSFDSTGKSTGIDQIAQHFVWSSDKTYRVVREAIDSGLIKSDGVNHQKNKKWVLPKGNSGRGFLPSPIRILKAHPELGTKVSFIDPIIGKRMKYELKQAVKGVTQ